MKRILLQLVFLTVFALSYGQGFVVKKFTAEYTMNPEGWFDVVERYDVVFTEYKHGLLRNIITDYNLDGKKRKIYISDIKVPGHKFSTPPRFIQNLEGGLEIKIGDEDKTIIGPQHYEIRYRVKNAYLFDDKNSMFYWNIKPDGWWANFESVEFRIIAPSAAKLSEDNSFIYSGQFGKTDISGDFDYGFDGNVFWAKSKESSIFRGNSNVTALVRMPRDMIAEVDYSPSFLMKYGWIGILGLIGLYFLKVWRKYGRDEKVIPVTGYYPPKGIDSAMAGYLINDRQDASDLISLIPKWGQEGLVRVQEISKSGIFGKSDTRIIKLKELPVGRPDYEQTMFDGLFSGLSTTHMGLREILDQVEDAITGRVSEPDAKEAEDGLDSVLVSSLKDSFYTTMNLAKSKLKSKAQKYYEPKSNKVMNATYIYLILGCLILDVAFLFIFGLLASIVCSVFFVFLIIMNGFMKKKNREGDRILSELKGFRQFIKLAEVNRIKTLIQSDPDYFEKTMSFALSFGLLKQWASKFESLHIPPPQWYSSTGNTVGIMSMDSFASSFSSSMASTQSAMVSSPSSSSSGGGSSGGGFGGGGGGSW